MLKAKSCKGVIGLWKLVVKFAKKYGVNNEDDLSQINDFIYTALNNDFFGPKGTIQIFKEKDFDFEVETEDGINYRLKGFIDRSFVYQKGNNLYLKIVDWKTSKEKFKDDKKDNNNQAICYQLAVTRYVFAEYPLTDFHFLFLKFPKSPVVAVDLKNKYFLNGYEQWLTHIQSQINSFSEKHLNDNYAALNPANKWLCGREGIKKDGTKMFLCSCRKPLHYYAAVDKAGAIKSTSFTDGIPLKDGEKIEKKFYPGCQFYYNAKGEKRYLDYA